MMAGSHIALGAAAWLVAAPKFGLPAVDAASLGLAVLGVAASAISCYYYLRVIVAMYFVETEADEDTGAAPLGVPMLSALYLCALGVLILGIFPDWLHRGATIVLETLG